MKTPYTNNDMERGYTAASTETLDPTNQTKGDTKQGFRLGRHVPEENQNREIYIGPNVYPDEKLTGLVGWRETVDAYMEKAAQVGLALIRRMAKILELPENYFDEYFTEPTSMMRLLHYTQEPSDLDKGVLGCGPHTDYPALTLLLTNDIPGLQLFHQEKWHDVPPLVTEDGLPAGYIINIGNLLEKWSNGRFKSTIHRVMVPPNNGKEFRNRLSAPFFFEPNYGTMINPVPGSGEPKFDEFAHLGQQRYKILRQSGDYSKAKDLSGAKDFQRGGNKDTSAKVESVKFASSRFRI